MYHFLAICLTCVLRFLTRGECGGQKVVFWPRHTGRAKRRSPTRETPVLRSQARAKDPFSRFFQAGLARKHRSTGPKCTFHASKMPQTHLKRHKRSVFVTSAPQRTVSTKTSSHIAKLDRRLRLRPRSRCAASLVTQIASRPKGTVFGHEMSTNGCQSARVDTPGTQISAQNPQLVGSRAAWLI